MHKRLARRLGRLKSRDEHLGFGCAACGRPLVRGGSSRCIFFSVARIIVKHADYEHAAAQADNVIAYNDTTRYIFFLHAHSPFVHVCRVSDSLQTPESRPADSRIPPLDVLHRSLADFN
jgi:hypothetical protein